MRLRLGIAGIAAVAAAAAFAPVAPAGRSHVFKATYTGHGSGQLLGGQVSGRGTATGRGNVIGSSRLTGSGTGALTTATCLSFNGHATLRGAAGAVKLAARGGKACFPTYGS